MVGDFLRNWLQRLRVPWWGIGVAYPALVLLLDVPLALIFGGNALLRELLLDPLLVYWLALVPGAISMAYVVNWRAIRMAIASLATNRVDVLTWRRRLFASTSSWLQWLVLSLSLALVLSGFWRYAVVRQEKTWFAKLPWLVYLLRLILTDLPVTYMVCMTVISIIDSTVALNRVFAHIPSAIVVDIWHPDGLYGLKPARELLLRQFGLGLLASFLPALMLLREAEQPYSVMYRAGVLIGVTAVIAVAAIALYNFSSAIERVQLSAMTTIADGLHAYQPPSGLSPQKTRRTNWVPDIIAIIGKLRSPQPPSVELVQEIHRTNLLLERQIAASLPDSLPLPRWLKTLGTSRILLLIIEFYSLFRPILGTPGIPDILRRLIELD